MIKRRFRVPLQGTLLQRDPPIGDPADPVRMPHNVSRLFGGLKRGTGTIKEWDFDSGTVVVEATFESREDSELLELLLRDDDPTPEELRDGFFHDEEGKRTTPIPELDSSQPMSDDSKLRALGGQSEMTERV